MDLKDIDDYYVPIVKCNWLNLQWIRKIYFYWQQCALYTLLKGAEHFAHVCENSTVLPNTMVGIWTPGYGFNSSGNIGTSTCTCDVISTGSLFDVITYDNRLVGNQRVALLTTSNSTLFSMNSTSVVADIGRRVQVRANPTARFQWENPDNEPGRLFIGLSSKTVFPVVFVVFVLKFDLCCPDTC